METYEYITVVLEKPIHEDNIHSYTESIKMIRGVLDAVPGKIDDISSHINDRLPGLSLINQLAEFIKKEKETE